MIFTEHFLPFRETLRGSFQGESRVGVNGGYESTGAGDAWYPGNLAEAMVACPSHLDAVKEEDEAGIKWDASMQRALDLFICFVRMERSGPASLSFGWDSLHQII